MTPEQIKLVRNSWQRVTPHTEAAAEAFYARLFDLDPHLRGMFKRDMKTQGRMLMSVIALAVSSLDDITTLLPAVRSLGRRHAGYGVRDHHYAIVGTALLQTLQSTLDDAFTPEVEEAWTAMYTLLAGVMKAAAAETPYAAAA